MKILLFIFVFISHQKSFSQNPWLWSTPPPQEQKLLEVPTQGLRIMWWNIACSFSAKGKKYQTNLDKNLLYLIQSKQKPDVLILGEYCPANFSHPTYQKIISSFKYSYRLKKYNPKFKRKLGLWVVSSKKITLASQRILSAYQEKSSVKDRPFLLFQLDFGGNKIFFSPVHLYHEWLKLYKKRGFFALSSIFLDEENPNAQQSQQLIDFINNNTSTDDSVIIIGDFNSPKGFFELDGYSYKNLNQTWKSLIQETTKTRSIFNLDLSIDHAFSSGPVKNLYNRVWPLAGSDHSALYIVVKPQ